MDAKKDNNALLELMQRPAFCVEDGLITYCNTAAAPYLLTPGTPVAPLIVAGQQEYAAFSQGFLHLTVSLGGEPTGVVVTQAESRQIWLPEQLTERENWQNLALIAMELRKSLSGAFSAAEQLMPTLGDAPDAQQSAAQVNRRLYQMLRIVSNMSDVSRYACARQGSMEYVEISGFVDEILEKAAAMAQESGIRLSYRVPREVIFTLADPEKLERAIYNLLSNAMKYTPSGGCVEAELRCQGKRLYFSVSDSGSDRLSGDIFTRFQREPGLYDSRWGIGLGLVLVRATAALHGGAVLLDRPGDRCNRVTMSLSLQQTTQPQLRCPILRIDYAGERDHALLELSDVLSDTLYSPEQLM